MSNQDLVYPRTLASLFGSEGEEVVWKSVFLLLLATWAAFSLPYAASFVPASWLRSFSNPAAFVLAGLIACRMSRKHTRTAFLAAMLYALLSLILRLVHPPTYAESQLAVVLEPAYSFLWSFLWLQLLSFCMRHIDRFWLALGLATAAAFFLGDLAAPIILNPRLDPSQSLASLDFRRMTTEFVRDLESAVIFAAVLFTGSRFFGYE